MWNAVSGLRRSCSRDIVRVACLLMWSRSDLFGDSERMAALMADRGTWAVVGLSNNRSRPAYGVAQFLINRGVRVVPIHPGAQSVHGQQGYSDLMAASRAVGRIDVVDVFLRSELVGPVVDQAIAIGASGLWMQLGVVDEAAAARARAAGLLTVMDACPAQEWDRLVPAFLAGASPVGGSKAPGTGDPPDADAAEVGEACAWAPPPTV